MNLRTLLSTGMMMFAGIAGLRAQQRTCDMSITLVSPAEGAVINAFAQFNITVRIDNLGPADLAVGDTVYYNTPSMFAFATAPYILTQAIASGANATVTLAVGTNVNSNTEDETSPYCVKVLSNPNNNGGFIDTTNDDNNRNCRTVTFKASGATAIGDLEKGSNTLQLYPNPASDRLTLAFGQKTTNGAVVVIRDIAGRELNRKTLTQTQTEKPELDIRSLVPGIYFVELNDKQGRFTGRFVKQ